MCAKFNHTQCGHTFACAVACLHPHDSISNVVVSLTIHDDTYIHAYFQEMFAKSMTPLWKVKDSVNRTSRKVSHVQIVHYIWVLSVSLSLSASLSLCVVVVEEGGVGGEGERLIEPSGS